MGLIQKLHDPLTIEHLELVGVAPGWRCLEVGAGGGSITRWLLGRVGPEGSVVATSLDTRPLDAIDAPNLEIRQLDIATEEVEHESFDLVHARFFLGHLSDYRTSLTRMVAALKPGGWLVVGDIDLGAAIFADADQRPGVPSETVGFAADVTSRMLATARAGGYHAEIGRRLPVLFDEVGLVGVGGEGRTRFFWVGRDQPGLGSLSFDDATEAAVAAGFLGEEDRRRYLERGTVSGFGTYTPFFFGAWGRKPERQAGAAAS